MKNKYIFNFMIILFFLLFMQGFIHGEDNSEGKVRLCILPFQTEDPSLEKVSVELADAVANKLKSAEYLEIIDAGEIKKLLSGINMKYASGLNDGLRKEIYKKLNCDLVLTGQVFIGKESKAVNCSISLFKIYDGKLVVAMFPGAVGTASDSYKNITDYVYGGFIKSRDYYLTLTLKHKKFLDYDDLLKRNIRICFIPIYAMDKSLYGFSGSFTGDFYKNIKKVQFADFPDQSDMEKFLKEIRIESSNDYNIIARKAIFERYKSDFVIVGRVFRENGKITMSYRIINVARGNFVYATAFSYDKYNKAAAEDLIGFLNKNKAELYKKLEIEYDFSENKFSPYEDDIIKRKGSICMIPFKAKNDNVNAKDIKAFNEELSNQFENKCVNTVNISNVLKGLKVLDSGDFNDLILSGIRSKSDVKYLLLGNIDLQEDRTENANYMITVKIVNTEDGLMMHWTTMLSPGTKMEYVIASIIKDLNNQAKFDFYKVNSLIEIWDKELGNKTVSSKFEYPSSDKEGKFIEVRDNPGNYQYYLHLPPDVETSGYSYPVFIYLHGVGGYQKILGPKMLLASPMKGLYNIKNSVPFVDISRLKNINKYLKGSIVIMPQLTEEERFWDCEKLLNILIDLSGKYSINTKRIYVAGESQGGIGTWEMGAFLHSRLAAIAPICGYCYHSGFLPDIPVWTFHAFDDKVIPPVESTNEALEILIPGEINLLNGYPHADKNPALPAPFDCTISYSNGKLGKWEQGTVYPKGRVTYTLYRTGGHNAWTPTYANENFWIWLYSQSR